MSFEEFKILVKGMKAVYTSEKFLPDGDSVKIWFSMLQDIPYNMASAAIQKYMLTNKFPPTIADIRELTAEVRNGERQDWGEAWEKVLKAIRRYGLYNQKKALDSLDPITRMTVERVGFRELCLSENIAVDRANFRMIYETMEKREKEHQQLPPQLREAISMIRIEGIGSMIQIGERNCNE